MVNVTTEIVILAPIQEVADYAADPDHAPIWYDNIKSIEWQSEKMVGVGSKMAFVAFFLGRRLAYTYEIVEYIPRQKLVMKTAEGPFPMETTYTWESVDSHSTKMKLRNMGEPSGFSKLMAPFMSMIMKKANQKDLQKLKSILEKSS